MLILRLNEIKIPENRQRREFEPEALQELADSIERSGLLHAPVVRPLADGWQLVAGERRLRAIRDHLWPTGGKVRYGNEPIEEGFVPCVPLGELDELAAEEAELDENIRRVDLTWQERASAVERLFALRSKQAAIAGTAAPTPASIAAEVFLPKRDTPGAAGVTFASGASGYGTDQTRKQLIVAKHLGNPEVAKAKSVDEAIKILKRQEATQRNVALAAEVGLTYTAALHEARNCDSLEWMAGADSEQFDILLTDPIYGMGADQFGDSGGRATGPHGYSDSYEEWQAMVPVLAVHSFRLCKTQAHAYVFCDLDRFHELRENFAKAGWWVHRTPIIWNKGTGGSRVPWTDAEGTYGPQRKWELILYAVKGKKPVTHIFPDLVTYPPDENLGHGAQKPVSLFIDLLRRSAVAGNCVFDPFAGSGTIFPACHELKLKALGLEKDAGSYGLCLKRLDLLKAQMELGI